MPSQSKFLLSALILSLALSLNTAQAAPHSLGANIINPEGTVFTVTEEDGRTVKRPYTSPGAFLSYSFNSWETVVGASSEDLALPTGSFIPPQDGKIICSDRGADKGTCYLMTESKVAPFVSEKVFKELGYDFKYAIYGDVSFLPKLSNIETSVAAHKPGSLINKDGTVYLSTKTGLLGLPNWETLTSWGYEETDIVEANSADKALPVVGALASKKPGRLNPTNDKTAVEPKGTAPVLPAAPTGVSVNSAGLAMLSPKGGETLVGGQTYTITWKAINISTVYLVLYKGNNCSTGAAPDIQVCGLAYNAQLTPPTAIAINLPNTGSYNWTVPTFLPSGNDYRIGVIDWNKTSHIAQSPGAFTITTSQTNTIPVAPTPTNTVPTPNISAPSNSISGTGIKVLTDSFVTGFAGRPYSGGAAYSNPTSNSYTVTFTELPTGLTSNIANAPANLNTTATIGFFGTPAQAGTYNVNLTFTAANQTKYKQPFSLVILPADSDSTSAKLYVSDDPANHSQSSNPTASGVTLLTANVSNTGSKAYMTGFEFYFDSRGATPDNNPSAITNLRFANNGTIIPSSIYRNGVYYFFELRNPLEITPGNHKMTVIADLNNAPSGYIKTNYGGMIQSDNKGAVLHDNYHADPIIANYLRIN